MNDKEKKIRLKSPIIQEKLKRIKDDPVLWAKAFIRVFSQTEKKIVPWNARWYQVEMLRDKSLKKVYRCGRRTGKTETMCIEALYKVNTNKSYTFLFATPFESQIRAIFDRLNEIIENSPLIKEKIISNTKNPFRVVFNNNSKIVGFTTGASNSAGAPAIRGQHADGTCIKII